MISISVCHIFVKIKSSSIVFILGLIYFPPDDKFSEIFDNLGSILNFIAKRYFDLPLVIGRDFNCKIASLFFSQLCYFSPETFSYDCIVNFKRKCLVELLESCNLIVLNGCSVSDSPANFTFIGTQGMSVVDLVWCS